jgi:hypothetical protein
MINFKGVTDTLLKSFPELKGFNDPFFQLLNGLKEGKDGQVIKILQSEIYPVIKSEISLGRAAAVYGVRNGSVDMILYGLVSEILNVDKVDYRDIIVEITLLYSGLKFMGRDADQIFNTLIVTLENHQANFLMKYLSRPSDLKTPESMGYKIITDPEFIFKDMVTFSK